MPITRIFILLYAVGIAAGQYSNLSAPGSGADLFFASTLPLKGSGAAPQERIFRIGSPPLSILAEGPTPVVPPKPPFAGESAWFVSDYYRFIARDASRDQSVVATTTRRDCHGGYGCYNYEFCQTTVTGLPGSGGTFSGEVWLSGNGRYLVSNLCNFPYGSSITDLKTMQKWLLRGELQRPNGRAVSDNGTAVFIEHGALRLFHDGQITAAANGRVVGNAVIDASGQTILYDDASGPTILFDTATTSLNGRTVRKLDIRTNQDTLFFATDGEAYEPSISSDGNLAMLLATGKAGGVAQLYVSSSNPFGTSIYKVTNEPKGVLSYTLSDDGRVAWYVSAAGSLVKLEIGTGNSDVKIPRTAQLTSIPNSMSAGSPFEIQGLAIPTSDIKVKIGGISAPVLSATETSILVQVPWEVSSEQSATVEVFLPDPQSPFDGTFRQESGVYAYATRLLTPAIHGDWSGFVTGARPAKPGEVLHFYASGLGPVQPPVPTGEPGPASPPAQTTATLACNAAVIYSGLAPGLVGYYQFSVRLPSSGLSSPFDLICSGPGREEQKLATIAVTP